MNSVDVHAADTVFISCTQSFRSAPLFYFYDKSIIFYYTSVETRVPT